MNNYYREPTILVLILIIISSMDLVIRNAPAEFRAVKVSITGFDIASIIIIITAPLSSDCHKITSG